MDAVAAIFNLVFFIIIVYLLSRAAHHFNNTKKKLNELDEKIDEIKNVISKDNN